MQSSSCILQKTLTRDTPSNAIIFPWVTRFKRGGMNLEDEERSGLPKRVIIPQMN